VKAVPQFLFIDDGAVVRRLSLRDIRSMTGAKPMVGRRSAPHGCWAGQRGCTH
jgi:hypothetical protein